MLWSLIGALLAGLSAEQIRACVVTFPAGRVIDFAPADDRATPPPPDRTEA